MCTHRQKVLRHFRVEDAELPTPPEGEAAAGVERYGLAVPLVEDLEEKQQAMARIGTRPFLADALEPDFAQAQQWIEDCGREVALPLNFCGGQMIIRLYRAITRRCEQTRPFMAAVHQAAAAYDFAFLALAHADDEADMTHVRNGAPTRYVTHPDTRAVDGINLLLSGLKEMQEVLDRWPSLQDEAQVSSIARHPLAFEITEELLHALRSASFPILLDRAGLGHVADEAQMHSGLAPLRVDSSSLLRVEAFARHRAHTYFKRAATLAALLAGYSAIDERLSETLDEIFALWGTLGAATDDMQDILVDFASGIHSVCAVMAHLCVAEDREVRPLFRQSLPKSVIDNQRHRLSDLFGSGVKCDPVELGRLLSEIELKRALRDYFEQRATLFADAIFRAVRRFEFRAELMIEMVAVVCRDPDFAVPEPFLTALNTIDDDLILQLISRQVGRFMTDYALARLWPTST